MFFIFLIIPSVLTLDNGLAARPGLGWNSDYCTACVHESAFPTSAFRYTGFQNEVFIKHIADFLNASGLQALGYENVNMDSLWNLPTRDAKGDLQPDPALWPSGFDSIVSYVHNKGLRFGVYGDRGNLDCNDNPGQLGHESQDAAFFAKNGIDWFKSDSCHASPDPETAFQEYGTMRDALNKTGRPIWFALCGWESWYAWKAPGKSLGNSWRVGVDTGGGWGPIMENMAAMLRGGPNGTSLAAYGGPGGWNDMCLLLNPGMGTAQNLMTRERHRSQFGLHCIFNANMLMTGNLSALDPYVLETWGNAEAIAVNQDTSHTFLQLSLGSLDSLNPARVAECGGEPSAQNWTFNAPASGFLTNAANDVCLNVADCETAIIFDGCTTTGSTCSGKNKFNNEQWTLNDRGGLLSALPGAACATVDSADGTLSLSPCGGDPLPSSQSWRYNSATGELVSGSGLCLTVSQTPPPSNDETVLVGRELMDGSWALLGLNNANNSKPLICGQQCLSTMGFPVGKTLSIRDIWAHQDLQPTAGPLYLPAPPNGGSSFWRVR